MQSISQKHSLNLPIDKQYRGLSLPYFLRQNITKMNSIMISCFIIFTKQIPQQNWITTSNSVKKINQSSHLSSIIPRNYFYCQQLTILSTYSMHESLKQEYKYNYKVFFSNRSRQLSQCQYQQGIFYNFYSTQSIIKSHYKNSCQSTTYSMDNSHENYFIHCDIQFLFIQFQKQTKQQCQISKITRESTTICKCLQLISSKTYKLIQNIVKRIALHQKTNQIIKQIYINPGSFSYNMYQDIQNLLTLTIFFTYFYIFIIGIDKISKQNSKFPSLNNGFQFDDIFLHISIFIYTLKSLISTIQKQINYQFDREQHLQFRVKYLS
ncbi:unnamed protein product [Paramecium sonneborni]|uniref:Transmembrane protein n=1 Tax=Paramecium sonneborni TaxID=65129 RepID=A0A8S1KUL5_9CILI|nr:unnamed protein product [Paramecium sonneborni]